MAQSDQHLLIQSPTYLTAVLLTALAAFVALLSGQLTLAAVSFLISACLGFGRLRGEKLGAAALHRLMRYLSLALCVIILAGIVIGVSDMSLWLYSLPLLVFFFYDFKPAIWSIGAFSVLAVLFIGAQDPLQNVQLTVNYIMSLGIGCSLVYLREVRRRQLKPLRRTDNLTMAATREHLDDDLNKEIQRSEREGSDLAVMALAIDAKSLESLSDKQKDIVIIDLGKLLHNNLRLFDSYYLWNRHEYLIILPHTSSAQAVKIANDLRVKVRKEVQSGEDSITISVGVAGLNVGDDCHSLPQRAASALQQTREKSSNQTQLYRDRHGSGSDADDAAKGDSQ